MRVFLMTDIEKSTEKWEKYHRAMGEALARHDAIMNSAVGEFGGRIIKHTGDGIFAVFENDSAFMCAVELQRRFAAEDWGEIGELRIRIGIHAGDAESRGGDFFGPVINRTARLMDASWGGQILITAAARGSCALPAGAYFIDLGLHQFSDLTEPQQVFQLSHTDLPVNEFPPITSLSLHTHNLPAQATEFVGRVSEVAYIKDMFGEKKCRLLTIMGGGGTGKTRLALQSAAELVPRFRHGVYFVPLAPLASGSIQILVFTIGDAVKFAFRGPQEPRLQLFDYLREKEMLLVLDNFEHLTGEAGLIGELMTACPGVRIMVTSRERLQLKGEYLFELKGLDIPAAGEQADPSKFSAVQLFIQAAQLVKPDFALSEENLSAVINICRLVDGLPLAIELAATWLRNSTCWEILQEVGKNIDFLASSAKDMPPRHRSLRAVFNYSWDLLSTHARVIFARLSIFQCPFSRNAASAVAAADLSDLSAFIDKSLLRRNADGAYEIHFLLKQYAQEKLSAMPDEETRTNQRFISHYAALLDTDQPLYRMAEKGGLFDAVAGEPENIRAAWQWAVKAGDWTAVARSCCSWHRFLVKKGWWKEGSSDFSKALDGLRSARDAGSRDLEILRMRLECRLASFRSSFGDYPGAQALLENSISTARRLQLDRDVEFCLNELGNIAYKRAEFDAARRYAEERLTIGQKLADEYIVANSLLQLGGLEFRIGNDRKALKLYDECLDIYTRLDDRSSVANALNGLGNAHFSIYEYDKAADCYEKSLEIHKGMNDRWPMAVVLNNLGNLARGRNQYREALRLFTESLAIKRDLGERESIGFTLGVMTKTLLEAGDKHLARKYLVQALETLLPIDATFSILNVMPDAIKILAAGGDHELSLEIAVFTGNHPGVTFNIMDNVFQVLKEFEDKIPPETVKTMVPAVNLSEKKEPKEPLDPRYERAFFDKVLQALKSKNN